MTAPDFSLDGCHSHLVPELFVFDMAQSRAFWVDLLGFDVLFARKAHLYLRMGEAEIMIAQAMRTWSTGTYDPPLGRGINIKMFIDDPDALRDKVAAAGWSLYEDMTEEWPVQDGLARGYRQFLVQDPNGYLLRFAKKLGVRPEEEETAPPLDAVFTADV